MAGVGSGAPGRDGQGGALAETSPTLGILGDLHGALTEACLADLDGRAYDALLVVGDLAAYRPGSGLRTAALLAQLSTPTFVIPGNHDAATLPQLGAEVLGQRALADRLAGGMGERVHALRAALGPARLCAYERVDRGAWQLVVGRPHTFGGPALAFDAWLREGHGVDSLATSAARLTELLLACDERPVVVLAHNGPTGLGARRTDPCGRDFHRDEGDWGDPDLAVALDAARAAGRDVRLVAFGHMHHALSGGGRRRRVGALGDLVAVNAARVPRVGREGERHHVRVRLGPELVVEEVWSGLGGDRVETLARRGSDGRVVLGA